jgi:hypothetical protein
MVARFFRRQIFPSPDFSVARFFRRQIVPMITHGYLDVIATFHDHIAFPGNEGEFS